MNTQKESFLRSQLVPLLQQVPPATPPAWGRLSFHQMVEHFTDSVRLANGHIPVRDFITPEDKLHRMREFMLSEKPFRENTPNPLMEATPPPTRFATVQAALGELQEELIYFFDVFTRQPGLTTRNPFFGDLNFAENVHLLHKHALHHLRQFGVVPEEPA